MASLKKLNFMKNLFRNNYKYDEKLSEEEKKLIEAINDEIKTKGSSEVFLNDTLLLSSKMFEYIIDLSKVKFTIYGGFINARGEYRDKYLEQRYIDRVTYSGYQAKAIIEKIEVLQEQIDLTKNKVEIARQIYDVVVENIPVARFETETDEAFNETQSLAGITSYNLNGREGLVCAGFAQLYKELCMRCGLKCEYVRGDAVLESMVDSEDRHAWNIVYTDNYIIPVDCCWGACSYADNIDEEFFGPNKTFHKEHQADEDELFDDYTSENIIEYIIQVNDKKFGNGINRLYWEVINKEPDSSYLTREGDSRALFYILDKEEVKRYLQRYGYSFDKPTDTKIY